MDILTRISQRYDHMRPAEQKVADLIRKDLRFASRCAIQQLAKKAGVSHASITRLAKTLACDDVRDLKLQLAQVAAVGERFHDEQHIEQQDMPEVYQSIQDILQVNRGLITKDKCITAAELILAANHCLIFGVGGGSTIFAQECQHRLFRLDVKSNAYSDPMLMRMTAASIDANDLLICLSLSGKSPDVLEAANIAKEYGGKIVAICPEGELSALADVHLPITTQEMDFIYMPSASRYVLLAAIDMLASGVAIKNQRKSREKLRRIKLQLDEHRGCASRTPLGD
ncbi:MurR/RpiR family transcriptional regulator [Thalassotalea sp. 1_MG-2023]|uniref:MurR/RpiR family transcriptional regulator n=1 Tax=Thalassotalea sp. 1_MG-2023 TaxID=3062680 RepID=UPI0026E2272C|nr:MurR/RpiR family transcriptional regulator [Thalassotalea sp. 1_MG-2023]MDO6425552.1 MurR/RpiR family transcriptional regulator [Thalassotalea sp. 1_MG-2023]